MAASSNSRELEYAKKRFRRRLGYELNIENPRTFNEKIQYKKIFDRRPILTLIADKYRVRQYVEEVVGAKYLVPLYGVFDDPTEIDFTLLPNAFVIKANHGWGWNILVEDKSNLDEKKVRLKLKKWLNQNYYNSGFEWAYKNIKPKVIIEQYLFNNGKPANDYKLHCFDGEPKAIHVVIDRARDFYVNYYDTSWNLLPVKRRSRENTPYHYSKPRHLAKMIEIASALSTGLDYVRVDLYYVNDRIYFGELTNYPGNGFDPFAQYESDVWFGEHWKLGNY